MTFFTGIFLEGKTLESLELTNRSAALLSKASHAQYFISYLQLLHPTPGDLLYLVV